LYSQFRFWFDTTMLVRRVHCRWLTFWCVLSYWQCSYCTNISLLHAPQDILNLNMSTTGLPHLAHCFQHWHHIRVRRVLCFTPLTLSRPSLISLQYPCLTIRSLHCLYHQTTQLLYSLTSITSLLPTWVPVFEQMRTTDING
jgi:hypothetical protein